MAAAPPEPPVGEDELQALVDDAPLSPARRAALDRWLEANPEEAARLRSYAAQRDALRAALAPRAAAPIPARLRIGHLRAARRRDARRRWQAAAAVAGLLLAGSGLGWTMRGGPAGEAPLAAAPRLEVRETEVAAAAAWLADHLGEAWPPPDLRAFGFVLAEARVLGNPGAGEASAHLRYRDAAGASVRILRHPTADPAPRELRCTDEPGGVVTYSFSDGRRLHLVTAALPRDRLRPIALAVERALRAPPPETPAPPAGGPLLAERTRRPCDLPAFG